MNIDELRKQLEIDEGVVHEIYLDHLGLPTFGIGHLITDSDQEHDRRYPVEESRCIEAFEQDIKATVSDYKPYTQTNFRKVKPSCKYDV